MLLSGPKTKLYTVYLETALRDPSMVYKIEIEDHLIHNNNNDLLQLF